MKSKQTRRKIVSKKNSNKKSKKMAISRKKVNPKKNKGTAGIVLRATSDFFPEEDKTTKIYYNKLILDEGTKGRNKGVNLCRDKINTKYLKKLLSKVKNNDDYFIWYQYPQSGVITSMRGFLIAHKISEKTLYIDCLCAKFGHGIDGLLENVINWAKMDGYNDIILEPINDDTVIKKYKNKNFNFLYNVNDYVVFSVLRETTMSAMYLSLNDYGNQIDFGIEDADGLRISENLDILDKEGLNEDISDSDLDSDTSDTLDSDTSDTLDSDTSDTLDSDSEHYN